MPELPEVETSRRGIAPWIVDRVIEQVIVRERRLRWPVPAGIEQRLEGQAVRSLQRRAKYLLIGTDRGAALMHLGMSGSLRIVASDEPAGKHDHVDIRMRDGKALRFRDPRRFGSLLWIDAGSAHPLLSRLGPEPLAEEFDGDYLWRRARGRRLGIKPFLMNANVVVGIGNIYASESLFEAGIHPTRQAQRVSRARMQYLTGAVKGVLQRALDAGGTTLRDFHGGDGEPGYFRQELAVYGRDGEPCRRCQRALRVIVQAQRSTYYCVNCQR